MSLNPVNTRSHSRRMSANNNSMNNPDTNPNQVNNINSTNSNNSTGPGQVDPITVLTELVRSLQLEVVSLRNQVVSNNNQYNTSATSVEQKEKIDPNLIINTTPYKDVDKSNSTIIAALAGAQQNYFNTLVSNLKKVEFKKLVKTDRISFKQWKLDLEISININKPLDSFILENPTKSWELFTSNFHPQELNFSTDELIRQYNIIQEIAFWLLFTSIKDVATRTILEDLKQDESSNYHQELNFKLDPSSRNKFYINANALYKLIIKRYNNQSFLTITELHNRLHALKYVYGQDPEKFINDFRNCITNITIVDTQAGFSEQTQVAMLLNKLPPQLETLKQQFLSRTSSFKLEDVCTALRNEYTNYRIKHRPNPKAEGIDSINYIHSKQKQFNKNKYKNYSKYNNNQNHQEGQSFKQRFTKENKNEKAITFMLTEVDDSDVESSYSYEEDYDSPDDYDDFTEEYPVNNIMTENVIESSEWVYDSGLTRHTTNQLENLVHTQKVKPFNMISAMKQIKTINTVGKAQLSSRIELRDVAYLPGSAANLISISKICDSDYQVLFTKKGVYVIEPIEIRRLTVIMEGKRKGGLYVYNADSTPHQENKTFIYRNSACQGEIPKLNDRKSNNENQSRSQNTSNAPLTTVTVKHREDINTRLRNAIRNKNQNLNNNLNNNSHSNDINAHMRERNGDAKPPNRVRFKQDTEYIQLVTEGKEQDSKSNLNSKLWHNRLGHQSNAVITNTLKEFDIQYNHVNAEERNQFCEACIKGKGLKHVIGQATANQSRKAEATMDCLHVDLVGYISIHNDDRKERMPTFGNKLYALVAVEEYSRFVFVKLLKTKSEVTNELVNIINHLQTLSTKKLKRLHTDNGTEFINQQLISYLKENGTEFTHSPAYTPQLNGIVERMNGKLFGIVRSMLVQSGAPEKLWGEALLTAVYLHNNTIQSTNGYKIPNQELYNFKVNINNLRIFGCNAYVYIEESKRGKIQPKFKNGIFVGYDISCSNSYRILDPETLEIIVTRNVKFNESEFTFMSLLIANATDHYPNQTIFTENNDDIDTSSEYEYEEPEVNSERDIIIPLTESPRNSNSKYPQRERKLVNNLGMININDLYLDDQQQLDYSYAIAEPLQPPQSYKKAIQSSESEQWKNACNEEYKSLIDNNTWTLVPRPSDRIVIPGRWVFAYKYDADSKPIKYKARFVAKGFKQIYGLDYDEVFAPVVRFKSIKMLLSIAAQFNLELKQIDFKTAFLNASLEHEIYVEQPEGYIQDKNLVCKLNKALYGLKQAPNEWYKELNQYLLSLGYKSTDIDD
ncbi:MAG: reverse transcriptase domain-containing protein [Nitrososphaeraceae archaeon]